MGRPTKCTPELTAEVAKHIEAGNYLEIAAALVGLNRHTVFNWMKWGKAEIDRAAKNYRNRVRGAKRPYVEFFTAITRASAKAEAADVKVLAESDDWRARLARLERKHRQRWGQRNQVDVGVAGSGNLKQKLRNLARNPEAVELGRQLAGIALGDEGEHTGEEE